MTDGTLESADEDSRAGAPARSDRPDADHMAISEVAQGNHDVLFPKTTLKETDPNSSRPRQLGIRRGPSGGRARRPDLPHRAALRAHRQPGAGRVPRDGRRGAERWRHSQEWPHEALRARPPAGACPRWGRTVAAATRVRPKGTGVSDSVTSLGASGADETNAARWSILGPSSPTPTTRRVPPA